MRFQYLFLLGLVSIPFLSGQTEPSYGQPAPAPAKADSATKTITAEEAVPQLMEAIGHLAGMNLYQTYLNIGFMADAKAEGVYEEDDVKPLLASIVTPLDTLEKKLDAIAKLAPTTEDRQAIEKVKPHIALLRKQAKELEAFWASGAEADGKKYEATRQQAWKDISELLGLNK